MKMFKVLPSAVCVALCVCSVSSADLMSSGDAFVALPSSDAGPGGPSAPINGGFEDGLSGWSASIENVTVFATESEVQRGAGTGAPWAPTEGQFFASLWSTNSDGMDFATLSQSFLGDAGRILTFDYFFDFGDVVEYPDSAVATLSFGGWTETLFEYNTPGHELAGGAVIDWTTFTFVLPESTTYTLRFLVADAGADSESVLGIDDVAVVPAPGAASLAMIAFCGLVFRRVRRR